MDRFSHDTLRLLGVQVLPFAEWIDVMVTISLKMSAAGDWRVCRFQTTLFRDLQLGAAIKLGREMARDEYQRSGCHVCVEMPGPIFAIVLARHVGDHYVHADAVAA